MSDQRFFFNTFKDVKPGSWKVNVVGTQLNVLGIESIAIHSFVEGKKIEGELCDDLYVPGLGTYFFSIGFATEVGIGVNFTEDKARFTKSGIQIMSGQRVGKSLYQLKIIAQNANQTTTVATVNTSISLSLIHLRLAHLN
jgi:hypothetical protein